MSSNNIVMPPVQPPSSTASNREDDESGTSTPSLMMVSPDDIFLERLSERFGNHPCVEVRAASNGGYSSNTTAPVSSEDTSTPEVVADQPSKECGDTPSKLPHHCFRYITGSFGFKIVQILKAGKNSVPSTYYSSL